MTRNNKRKKQDAGKGQQLRAGLFFMAMLLTIMAAGCFVKPSKQTGAPTGEATPEPTKEAELTPTPEPTKEAEPTPTPEPTKEAELTPKPTPDSEADRDPVRHGIYPVRHRRERDLYGKHGGNLEGANWRYGTFRKL